VTGSHSRAWSELFKSPNGKLRVTRWATGTSGHLRVQVGM